MKKLGLTIALLFLPVTPVLGGHVAAAQDSNSLTVQMPSANDQAPPASTTTPVQPAAPQAARQPQDSGQTGQTGQSQPSQQDQPAAAPAQAPAQGDTSKTNPAPAEDASQAPTPAVQDSASPAAQTPAVAQDATVPAVQAPAAVQDQTTVAQDVQASSNEGRKSLKSQQRLWPPLKSRSIFWVVSRARLSSMLISRSA